MSLVSNCRVVPGHELGEQMAGTMGQLLMVTHTLSGGSCPASDYTDPDGHRPEDQIPEGWWP